MTPDFVRSPEDKVRLWQSFKRNMMLGGGVILLFLLLLAVLVV